MKSRKNNRGTSPKQLTKYMLCSISAGRCHFCNKFLFTDAVTLEDNNDSNLAHIVASSPDGPRGDEKKSQQLSDKIENLMLMCQEHHHLIDAYPEKYTVETLKDMKKAHEERVRSLCASMNLEKTEIIIFQADIKGQQLAKISPQHAVLAFIHNKMPFSKNGTRIELSCIEDYHAEKYWELMSRTLEHQFKSKIVNALEFNPQLHFSVFPLAPIPLIVKLGYLMGDKIRADVYQKTRLPDTWKWQSEEVTNSFEIIKHPMRSGNRTALILSLTANVSEDRVIEVFDADIIYAIRASRLGVDCIQSSLDLSEFWHKYQEVCDEITNTSKRDHEVNVFPALPVSAAFEVGRHYMPRVYPKLVIYDDNNGFFKSLSIGG